MIKTQHTPELLRFGRYFRFIFPLVLLLCTACNNKAEEVAPKPVAKFLYSVDTDNTLLVKFMNASENGVSYTWDFGDNTGISNDENPAHTYASGGTYNVTLTVKNSVGASEALKRQVTVKRKINKISILGDSYSTFSGYLDPSTNATWYPDAKKQNDVVKVEQTWWYPLVQELGATIEKNNSFSGATVCTTGYNGANSTYSAFISRMNNLGNSPDLIIIMGGTNDSAANSPIGEFKYSGWTDNDLKSFRPAFAKMLDYLTKNYPDAIILNVINSDLKADITNSQTTICTYYMVDCLQLVNINKQNGHPSINGMAAIKKQILDKITAIGR